MVQAMLVLKWMVRVEARVGCDDRLVGMGEEVVTVCVGIIERARMLVGESRYARNSSKLTVRHQANVGRYGTTEDFMVDIF